MGVAELRLKRRMFLSLGGLTLPALALPGCDPGGEASEPLGKAADGLEIPAPSFAVEVLRREDMLSLRFAFVNFQPDAARRAVHRVLPTAGMSPTGFVLVSHGRQHVLERAYTEANDDDASAVPAHGPIRARISDGTRVAYRIPDDTDVIPLTIEDLLDAARDLQLSVVPNALPRPEPSRRLLSPAGLAFGPLVDGSFQVGSGAFESTAEPPLSRGNVAAIVRATRGIRALSSATGQDLGLAQVSPGVVTQFIPREPVEPGPFQTAIELPYRLILSPSTRARWGHSSTPVTHGARTELWHTRLGVRADDGTTIEGASYFNTVRAVWTRDPAFDPTTPPGNGGSGEGNDPFLASLSPDNRERLVHQTSNFVLQNDDHQAVPTTPVDVNRLMLTALGGYLDVRGDFRAGSIGLLLWEHRATLGRDHYVKVVESGRLYPFGHRAALVTITERKLKEEHPHVAYLRQRQFVVVKEPVIDFTASRDQDGFRRKLRQLPFLMIEIKTRTTPNLVDENGGPLETTAPDALYLSPGKPFHFSCEALDSVGRVVSFKVPLVWAPTNGDGAPITQFNLSKTAYGLYGDDAHAKLSGQRMAFAPASSPDDTLTSSPDDTTYAAYDLTFDAFDLSEDQIDTSGYASGILPYVTEAELDVEAASRATQTTARTKFGYHATFVQHGFETGNPGEILFEVTGQKKPVDFSGHADRSGGFLAPSFSLSGLSRKNGVTAGTPATVASNHFDPSDFFGGSQAKLFGTLSLSDIIQSSNDMAKAPRFSSETLDVVERFLVDAASLEDSFRKILATHGSATLADLAATLQTARDLTDAGLAALSDGLSGLGNSSFPGGTNRGKMSALLRKAEQIEGLIDALGSRSNPDSSLAKYLLGQELPTDGRVRFVWEPDLVAYPSDDNPTFRPSLDDGTPASIVLSAEIRATDTPEASAGTDLTCSIDNFTLFVFRQEGAVITVPFEHLGFIVRAGETTDVEASLGEIAFGGALEFIETLREMIPIDGFSDSSGIVVDESGISSNFSVGLPSLAVGVFSLQNISLGAGFTIPFVGDPISLSFNFCTRENPFLLTVMMVGGGGFVGLTVDADGIRLLEAELEAGAELAMDFGVAGGSVSVMVGVYFRIEQDACELTAFLKIHGEVDVLGGLISAALTLELDLTYQEDGNKLIGRASMEIEVSILFFSFSVSVDFEAKLAGDNDDPTFADHMRPALPAEPAGYAPWDDYVDAFAA